MSRVGAFFNRLFPPVDAYEYKRMRADSLQTPNYHFDPRWKQIRPPKPYAQNPQYDTDGVEFIYWRRRTPPIQRVKAEDPDV